MTTAISTAATSEQTRELTADELSVISGGIKRSSPTAGLTLLRQWETRKGMMSN